MYLSAVGLLLASTTAVAQSAPTADPRFNVSGRVVNGMTGAAIPRALVKLDGRAVLTDPLGQFSFPGFQPNGQSTAILAYAEVSKPGYASTLDPMEGGSQPITDTTEPVELKLYPDGLITGTVTGNDGEPLEHLPVAAFREMGDESSRHLQQVGVAMTDSRGEYRFDEPPGRYGLLIRYSPRGGDAGQAVLPQRYPPEAANTSQNSFTLGPGDQQKIDFQVRTGVAYPVTLRVETSLERGPNFLISARANSGESFTNFPQPGRTPGEFHIDLPSGTYALHATQQLRDHTLEAESRVTVAGHAVDALTLHFVEVGSIPVQVLLDTSTAGSTTGVQATEAVQSQTPTPLNLNLNLHKVDDAAFDGSDTLRVTTLPNKSFAINAGSGTYRLTARPNGQWFITRATYGTTDLFTHTLTLGSGAGGESIQITASNAFGDVTGTLRKSGVAASGYVYLFARQESLVPVYTARVGRDGSYAQRLPPGTYTVVALAHRYPGDLRDPAVQAQLEHGSATVQVTAGGQATLDLEQQALGKDE